MGFMPKGVAELRVVTANVVRNSKTTQCKSIDSVFRWKVLVGCKSKYKI